MLNLQDEAEYNLAKMPEAAMLVHCSAGMGRTGAFIGLFKLIRDFRNRKVRQDTTYKNNLRSETETETPGMLKWRKIFSSVI